MKIYKPLTLIVLLILCTACGPSTAEKKTTLSITTNAKKGNISNKATLELHLKNPKNYVIDSVAFQLNGQRIPNTYALDHHKLGKHPLDAIVYLDGTSVTLNSSITILSATVPKVFTFKIINTYPHDITSYTQGLEFYNGILYESTGQFKASKLRQVDHATRTLLKNINLDDAYFGEGLTIINDKAYQLTWRSGTGFVYNAETLEKISSFKYGESKEGWGLTHDDTYLYKSDGTENIWLLDPETLIEKTKIQAYTHKGKITELNELEWINGKIYANRYQKNGVAIINPKNGAIEGVIDFSPLRELVTAHDELDVLNGIAYNPSTKTIFVTGKYWDKLFEVEILE